MIRKGAFFLKEGKILIIALALALITSLFVSFFNSKLGELLGVTLVQMLLIIFWALVILGAEKMLTILRKKERISDIRIDRKVEKSEMTADNAGIPVILEVELKMKMISNKKIIVGLLDGDKRFLGRGTCFIQGADLIAVKLYTGYDAKELIVSMDKNENNELYYVNDNTGILVGQISSSSAGLILQGMAGGENFSAVSKTAISEGEIVDWLIAIDTLNGASSACSIEYFEIYREKEMIGKYFPQIKSISYCASILQKEKEMYISVLFALIIEAKILGNKYKRRRG